MNELAELAAPKPIISAAAETDQQRAMGEVQVQMVLAKKFPRNEIQARDRLMNSCMRSKLAELSQYSFPRGGQEITGPSIDLLVVAASCWGNIMHGWRELNRSKGSSEVEAFVWDLETNVRIARTINVKHIRDTKQGPKVLTEERDINEICANFASRSVRTCLEKVIPPDIIDDAVNQCNATLRSKVEINPEKIKNMLEQFSEFEVTKEMIENRIQRRLDSITPPQVISLGRVYKSLKDGMSKTADWFDSSAGKAAIEPKTEPKAEKQKSAPKTTPAPQIAESTPDTEKGEDSASAVPSGSGETIPGFMKKPGGKFSAFKE